MSFEIYLISDVIERVLCGKDPERIRKERRDVTRCQSDCITFINILRVRPLAMTYHRHRYDCSSLHDTHDFSVADRRQTA